MEGKWVIWCGVGLLLNHVREAQMRRIAAQAHAEEIKSIRREMRNVREEMKTLQASNDELIVLLNKSAGDVVGPEIVGYPSPPCTVEHQPRRRKYLFSLISSLLI
ncbi:hypothetical protein QYE76_058403 [Lolium multiflorum]|uniref:Uncharacterized protein n=1 Tax=Lolium multiflorum TaxID=4521 RepID=A0AAD8T6H8_LOLMU|nr:hypothetical protein QYE76_058403 [Lolium multiflorum]